MAKRKYYILVENSAPTQTKPSAVVGFATNVCREAGCKSVIDVGCGRLRHLAALGQSFEKVWVVDTQLQYERTKQEFATLMASYPAVQEYVPYEEFKSSALEAEAAMLILVLHVIPRKEERISLLRSIHKNLRAGGLLFVAVPFGEPYYKQRMTNENKYLDGFVMGASAVKTFHKEFTERQLKGLLRQSGFDPLGRLGMIRRQHSWACQKV